MVPKTAQNVLKAPAALAAASVLIVGLAIHAAQVHAAGAASPPEVLSSVVQDKMDSVPLEVLLFVHRPGAMPAGVPASDTRAERCPLRGNGDCDRETA
ncbi:MAG TPA: hypothetical protein PL143_06555 [Rhodocyclaceae bacterium]|nr:hypothetical protein [Rhodocyclaceae bacterium]